MKIGLDIDDVLIDFNTGFLSFFNERTKKSFVFADITSYDHHVCFGFPKEEVQELIDEFMFSNHHIHIPPVEGVLEGLKKLRGHEVILISARQEKIRKLTIDWIEKHLEGLVDVHSVVLTGQFHVPNSKKKGQIAKELSLDIFVEDSLGNAQNIAENGIPVLLFDTPWNQDSNLPPLIIRVKTWEEIVTHINKIEG